MTTGSTDEGILATINRLVNEERELWNTEDLDIRGRGSAREHSCRDRSMLGFAAVT
jgi:hypothetical protein